LDIIVRWLQLSIQVHEDVHAGLSLDVINGILCDKLTLDFQFRLSAPCCTPGGRALCDRFRS
jgi:hypothetical protein